MEKVSGDIHLTPQIMKPSNSPENDVKQGNDSQLKQDNKRKRKEISKTSDMYLTHSLKKTSNAPENDVKQGNALRMKQDKNVNVMTSVKNVCISVMFR